MNRELRDKWVTALRSGEYKQGRTYLYMNNEYCCLGVLCVVAGVHQGYLYNRGTLNNIRRLKLLSDNPHIDTYRCGDAYEAADALETKLVSMNDQDYSFADIADYIEANVPVEA